IMTNDEEMNKLINRNVFPGVQGGPLMHIITAKAVAFGEALQPGFRDYQQRVVKNAQTLAKAMTEHGYRITSGGTDNHLMLVSLLEKDAELTGKDCEKWLEDAGIITNKNGIPDDPRSPMITSGLRLGTPATTTRGFGESEMQQIASWINRVIESRGDEPTISQVRTEVRALCVRFPLPHAAV
ncbi:MAG: serine hydroxymethyltransferase, partial [Phycisphaerales bacterium]|nr:serine hydroxymethyltransferase [Phycisphaerales bacterium]